MSRAAPARRTSAVPGTLRPRRGASRAAFGLVALSVALGPAWALAQDEVRGHHLSAKPRESIVLFVVVGEDLALQKTAIGEAARRTVEANMHARIVTPEEAFVQAGLDLQTELAQCRGEDVCYGRLVGRSSIEAPYLLVVTALLVGDERVLGARFVDLYAMRALGSALEPVASEGALVSEVPARIEECVPRDLWSPFGSLALDVAPPGAEVLVNGNPIGVAPLGKVVGLLPGEYLVAAKKAGYLPAERRVTVLRRAEASLALQLEEEPTPVPWWLIGLIAGVVVAGAATGIAIGVSGGPSVFCSAPDPAACAGLVD